jgi:HlyD family secretion protein
MFKNIKKAIVFTLALLVLASALAGCSAPADTSIAVKTASVAKKPLTSDITLSGVLVPMRTISVTSKLSGQALTVNADVGGPVKKGDTLVSIETKTLSAQLKTAEAQVKQAKAALKASKSSSSAASNAAKAAKGSANTAKINYESALEAYNAAKTAYAANPADPDIYANYLKTKAAKDVAKSQYDTARGPAVNQATSSSSAAANNVHTAEAAVDVAEANVNSILVQMENADVLSPIDGVVLNRNINVGEIVPVTSPVFTLADVGTLKLKATVSQDLLPFLSEGQNIDVAVDIYPGQKFAGTVSLVGPMAVATGEYFPIEISVPNKTGLKPGLTAHAALNVQKQQNPVVPVTAVQKENDKSFVYVVEDGRAMKRAVTTGLGNTNDIEILTGLNEGETVAVNNVNLLSDNMPVRVQDESKAK